MEISFPKNSPAGLLYQDIKNHSQTKGVSPESLDKAMDTGYVEDCLYQSLKVIDPGIISEGEVLEYAYRFGEFYPYLHKYGFPVPFVLDDFNAETAKDEKIREQIHRDVQTAKEELEKERVAQLGTDAYKLALARKIYERILNFTKEFSSNGEEEHTVLEACILGTGECTERSSILFYAYQVAGLEPHFFVEGSDQQPTLDKFFSLPDNSLRSGHVFIGLEKEYENRWVYIDVTQKEFDTNHPAAVHLTPRQFVYLAYLNNKISQAAVRKDFVDMEESAKTCQTVAPRSFYCFLQRFYSKLSQNENPIDIRKFSDAYHPLVLKYKGMNEWVHFKLKEHEALQGSTGRRPLTSLMEEVEQLSKVNLKMASRASLQYGEGIWKEIKPQLEKDENFSKTPLFLQFVLWAKSFLIKAIELDPNYLYSFRVLERLREAYSPLSSDLFPFFHELAKKNPQHIVAHFFAAHFGILFGDQKVRAQIEEHINALRQLEPDHVMTHKVYFGYLLMQNRTEEAEQFLENTIRDFGPRHPTLLFELFLFYFNTGKRTKAMETLREMLKLFPEKGYDTLFKNFAKILSLKYQLELSNESEKEKQKSKEKMEIMVFLISIVELLAQDPSKIEEAKILYAKIMILAALGGVDSVHDLLLRRLEAPLPKRVEDSLLEELKFFVEQMRKIKWNENKFEIKSQAFGKFLPLLNEEGGKTVALGYVVMAEQRLKQNEKEKAMKLLKRAESLRNDVFTMEIYGKRVIQELFSPVVGNVNANESDLDIALSSLELISLSKSSADLIKMQEAAYRLLSQHYERLGRREQMTLIQTRLSLLETLRKQK